VAGDGDKKQVLLRLSPGLWRELAAWAEDDFRSINGQIEYLLSEAVKKRKAGSGPRNSERDARQDQRSGADRE